MNAVKVILLILTLMISQAWAELRCTDNNANRPAWSLKDPGRSLQNFQVQSQDGLGVCYANALSVMLEGAMPGHPQLSFQQIAILQGQAIRDNDRATGRQLATYTKEKNNEKVEKVFTESGWSCRAFKEVKKRGSLCRRSHVPMEQAPRGSDQDLVFRALGKFYDAVTVQGRAISNPGQRRQYYNDLTNALTAVRTESVTSCTHPMSNPPVKDIEDKIKTFCQSRYTIVKNENLMALMAQAVNDDVAKRAHEATRDEAQVLFDQACTVEEDGSKVTVGIKPSVETAMVNEYWRMLEDQPNNPLRAVERFLNITEISPRFFGAHSIASLNDTTLRRDLMHDLQVADPATCQNALTWSNLRSQEYLAEHLNPRFACLADELSGAFDILVQSNAYQAPLASAITAITRFDQNIHDYIMGIIGPECISNSVSIPQNLTCDDIDFPRQTVPPVAREHWSPAIDGPGLRLLNHNMGIMRTNIDQSLAIGRPVGISVCTGFFKSPLDDTSYNTECAATGPHGQHAMTIIGHRCVNGSLQYQVQNSWGTGCGFVRSVEESWEHPGETVNVDNFDCQDGAFWVDESVLIKNTSRMSVLH